MEEFPTPKPTRTPNQSIEPLTYRVDEGTGHAFIGNLDVVELAQTYGTPLYLIDGHTFREMARAYRETLETHYPKEALILYAAKANLNMGLCKLAQSEGLGIDAVSGGELYTLIQAGFPLENVVFNGNNKSIDELELALHHKVGRIIVDNPDELAIIHALASKKGLRVPILLRINPGIECHTHDYIKTGQVDSKFGINMPELGALVQKITTDFKDTIDLKGLHAHIGSQIFETRPYVDLIQMMLNIYYNIRENFEGLELSDLNIGGGLGVAYTREDDPLRVTTLLEKLTEKIVAYAEKIQYPLPRLMIEPGRSLIANAGVTLYSVGSRKQIPGIRNYISVDGGMGDNIRPALYQAKYNAVLANKAGDISRQVVTVAGKYCESGDIIIPRLEIPTPEPGDILMVFGTGAYNYTMASNYNRIARPAMLLLENNEAHLLVRRETYDHVCSLDVIPSYLLNVEIGATTSQ